MLHKREDRGFYYKGRHGWYRWDDTTKYGTETPNATITWTTGYWVSFAGFSTQIQKDYLKGLVYPATNLDFLMTTGKALPQTLDQLYKDEIETDNYYEQRKQKLYRKIKMTLRLSILIVLMFLLINNLL